MYKWQQIQKQKYVYITYNVYGLTIVCNVYECVCSDGGIKIICNNPVYKQMIHLCISGNPRVLQYTSRNYAQNLI